MSANLPLELHPNDNAREAMPQGWENAINRVKEVAEQKAKRNS